MHCYIFLTVAASFAALVNAADVVPSAPAQVFDDVSEGHQLLALASFPESNPFGHVVNGESNTMEVKIENSSGHNITLLSIAGGFYNPTSNSLIKPANNVTYGLYLLDGAKITLPYEFHSELKTGDVNLRLDIEYIEEGERLRTPAFNSDVTVVEPELSLFDLKLLSTYTLILVLLGGLSYFAYLSFVPQPKKSRKPPTLTPEAVTATGASGYQEEWIPEHHLKKVKKAGGYAGSGDELSGGETSGAEAKKRKGRK